jgi:hypothetical protein
MFLVCGSLVRVIFTLTFSFDEAADETVSLNNLRKI